MDFITVLEAETRLQRQYNDNLGEIDSLLYLDWLNDLNYLAYEVLFKNYPWDYSTTTTINASSGTTEYALPADFKSVNAQKLGLYEVDSSGTVSENGVPPTSPYSKIDGFWIKRGSSPSINLTGNAAGDKTYQFRYVPRINPLTGESDELVINTENFSAIIQWLDKEYGQWNNRNVQELNASERFRAQLEKILVDATHQARVLILNRSYARV